MKNITINGRIYESENGHISIFGKDISIDGKAVEKIPEGAQITIVGDIAKVSSDEALNVKGSITAACTAHSIQCENIKANSVSSDNINCNEIKGDVYADCINCNNIYGSITPRLSLNYQNFHREEESKCES